MSELYIAVSPTDIASDVLPIIQTTPYPYILVIEDDKLQGIITASTVLRAHCKTTTTSLHQLKMHEIMEDPAQTVHADQSIFDVCALFTDHQIMCVPVIDSYNSVLGIIHYQHVLTFLLNTYSAH